MHRLRASEPKVEMLRSLSEAKEASASPETAAEAAEDTDEIEEEVGGDEQAKDADVADGDIGEGNEEEDPEDDPPVSPKDEIDEK